MEIFFREKGKTSRVPANEGENLLECARRAGVLVDAPCGGAGRCGGCRVRVEGPVSLPSAEEIALLGENELEAGVRLACRCRAADGMIVSPVAGGAARQGGRDPFEASLAPYARAADGSGGIALAVDIGTTTLALYFHDAETLEPIGRRSAPNPQRAYGADVMSRIDYCIRSAEGLERLRRILIDEINSMVAAFCAKTGRRGAAVRRAAFAGNTAMMHIAAGISPAGLSSMPFRPADLFGRTVPAEEIGLAAEDGAEVFLMPCVSAFVGADAVAAVLACGLARSERKALLVDLGTNAEIVLGDKDGLLSTSAAAGPAFEGAHMRFGTGGVAGAISRVCDGPDGPVLETIGGAPAIGICGAGLVDAAALMLEKGVMDGSGRFAEPSSVRDPRYAALIRRVEGEPAFILDEKTGICVTQTDIRQLQLAKSAIAAGIFCLLERAGTGAEDIERLYLAGGFGYYIDRRSAARIGLFPSELEGKAVAAGDAAGAGASMALLSDEHRREAMRIAELARQIDLASDPAFASAYIDNMAFGPLQE